MPSPERQTHIDPFIADIPREQLTPRERRIIQILEIGEKGTQLAQEATIVNFCGQSTKRKR